MSKYEKFSSSTSKKVDHELIRDLDEIAQE